MFLRLRVFVAVLVYNQTQRYGRIASEVTLMSTVEEIVQAVKDLPPEKWDEVRMRLLRFWLSSDRPDLAKGIESRSWSNLHSTVGRTRSHPRKPAIQIKGKPISETIVEDRR